jgi:hypothetical protein
MNATSLVPASLIEQTNRKLQYRRQTVDAARLETLHATRNADLQSSAFMTHVILPILKNAEAQLLETSISAMTTAHIRPNAARCRMTVTLDEDRPPMVLTFEARLGSTIPQIRWTCGGPVHTVADLDRAKIEQIVNDLLARALRRDEPDI